MNMPSNLVRQYPTGSGKYTYDNTKFEAVESPPLPQIEQKLSELSRAMPALPAGMEPYFERQAAPQPAKGAGQ